MTRPPVVVAVSGHGSDAAIRFGAAETARDAGTLHLVRVRDLDLGRERQVRHLEPVTTRQAELTLSRAVDHARGLAGGAFDVSSELFHGTLVDGLVMVSRSASLVVLQGHSRGTRSTDPRSTSTRVAARATVPVVSVPRDWDNRRRGTVTVGVDDPLTCAPLLMKALSWARSRQTRLRVVHVGWDAEQGDADRRIRVALAETVGGPPATEVTIQVVDGGAPGAVLIEAMETSELLVVGRHHPLVPRGSQLGPVARRVLREASCPVLLLTPSASVSSAEWVFEGHLA